MTSKGKGKGKGLPKKFDLEAQTKLFGANDGALDDSYFIMALTRNNKWAKARIL